MRFKRAKGRTVRHVVGRMNKLEASYAARLDLLKAAGEVHDYRFESAKFRLADNTYYTPDFMVIAADGGIEFHEVKGFWEEDARVKIKVFAEMYPWFVVKGVQWDRHAKGWETEEFAVPKE